MTDRELLEFAAKAAGVDVRWYQGDCLRVADKCNGFAGKWNPLTDDGDALRLAVRLAMTVRQEASATAAGWGANCFGAPTVDRRGPWFRKEWLSDNQDPYAATRRAITRAAVEIGRKL